MNAIDSITHAANGSDNKIAPSAANAAAAKEQFLTLLVAQISHQNPMKPMDDKDLITQLAQFSSVEQAIETNSRLASLQQAQAASARLGLASWVGKDAAAQTRHIHMDPAQGQVPLAFTLDNSANDVKLSIMDESGTVVHNINAGALAPGAHALAWDGRLPTGQSLPQGDYTVRVTAQDRSGNTVPVHQEIRGTIHGVDFEGNESFVQINGVKIRSQDVVQLKG